MNGRKEDGKENEREMNRAGGSFSSCDNEKLYFYNNSLRMDFFFCFLLSWKGNFLLSSSRMDGFEMEKKKLMARREAKTVFFFG